MEKTRRGKEDGGGTKEEVKEEERWVIMIEKIKRKGRRSRSGKTRWGR